MTVFLAIFALLFSHIARYAPSEAPRNYLKNPSQIFRSYYLTITKNNGRCSFCGSLRSKSKLKILLKIHTESLAKLEYITVDAYQKAVPFYEKSGFVFMGNDERQRYIKGKKNTIAMYYDLMNVAG